MNRYTILDEEGLKAETKKMADKSKAYIIRSDILRTSEAGLIRAEWEMHKKIYIWNQILKTEGVI